MAIARYYGIDIAKISVIPAGVDLSIFHPIDDEFELAAFRTRVFGEDAPFLLYVGKPTKRRNLPNLIRAFAELKRNGDFPHRLLLVGTGLPGQRSKIMAVVAQEGIERWVKEIPFAPHEEIALAYNAADLLAYPSSYEGFGMPVLEAMACGTPTVTLDNTAFPEFASGVALLLPDAEVETLTGAIRRVLEDETLRSEMRAAGPPRAAQYEWGSIARSYLDLLLTMTQAEAAE